LITTESNADIQAVHDRMPLMIPIQAHKEWLKGTINKSRLIEMNSAISMEAHTVSRRVNSTLNNDPKLIDRKDPANDDQLRLF
jgi:putative SOS response-associated peptidase YedK